jgi:Xaa-Pro dipeptidase
VKKHWHKRIVRSGPNTVCIFAENPPVREIAAGDTVFLDLGPVFDEWEADVGRTYVMGDDPVKRRLCQDLPRIFDALKQYFDDHRDVTGAELYAYAEHRAEAAGWLCGGAIAGHIVGEFPHAHSRRQGSLPDQPREPRTDARPGRCGTNAALDYRGAPDRSRSNLWRVL